MSSAPSLKPAPDEYAPYFERYISRVPEGDIQSILEQQLVETLEFLARIPEARAGHRYAEGKWSIKEVIGHLIDGERVFAYRALCFARGDAASLPGFEQDDYVKTGQFDQRTLSDLAEEYGLVRRSTIALFKGLAKEAWLGKGVANENSVTVRAIAYIMAGHVRHHMDVIRDRYLS
jgi:hypothetical protein